MLTQGSLKMEYSVFPKLTFFEGKIPDEPSNLGRPWDIEWLAVQDSRPMMVSPRTPHQQSQYLDVHSTKHVRMINPVVNGPSE